MCILLLNEVIDGMGGDIERCIERLLVFHFVSRQSKAMKINARALSFDLHRLHDTPRRN